MLYAALKCLAYFIQRFQIYKLSLIQSCHRCWGNMSLLPQLFLRHSFVDKRLPQRIVGKSHDLRSFLHRIAKSFARNMLNNILYPAVKQSTDLIKNGHTHILILAKLCKCCCGYFELHAQLTFCDSPINKEFPKWIIRKRQLKSPLVDYNSDFM